VSSLHDVPGLINSTTKQRIIIPVPLKSEMLKRDTDLRSLRLRLKTQSIRSELICIYTCLMHFILGGDLSFLPLK
jgi:hypothetical protein